MTIFWTKDAVGSSPAHSTSSPGPVQTLTFAYRNLAPKEYVTTGSTLKPHRTWPLALYEVCKLRQFYFPQWQQHRQQCLSLSQSPILLWLHPSHSLGVYLLFYSKKEQKPGFLRPAPWLPSPLIGHEPPSAAFRAGVSPDPPAQHQDRTPRDTHHPPCSGRIRPAAATRWN